MCDAAFMHSGFSSKGERLQVCSGYLGRLADGEAYSAYPLSATEDWLNTAATPTSVPETTHWLRTTDPADPTLIHSGAYHHTGVYDVPMGFLGGISPAANGDPVLEAMGDGVGLTFSRCIDRVQCEMPPFTFAGVKRVRLDPLRLAQNLTETSLRRCGSTGTWTGSVCRLDDRLFPLFSFLLWGDGGSDPKPRGCFALWPSAVHMRFVGHVPNVGETVATFMSNPSAVTSVTAASADGGLLCATDGCLYAGRTSTVLTPAQTSDTIAQVASNLNSLAAAASDAVLTRTAAVGALTAYEDITLCEASVREYKGLTQAAYAEAYWTPSPPQLPGLYTAFRLALYEYPVEWLFTSMRTTLLASLSGHANDVHAVNTRGMTSGAVKSALWDSDTHDALCSPGRLGARPALFYLLCNGLQPSYATLPAGVTWPSDTTASLRVHTRQALVDDVLKGTSQSGLSARCMYAASWACPTMPVYDAEYAPCWDAAWLAQSPEVCRPRPHLCSPFGISIIRHERRGSRATSRRATTAEGGLPWAPPAWCPSTTSTPRTRGSQQLS